MSIGWMAAPERKQVRFRVKGAIGETRVRVTVSEMGQKADRATRGMVVALVTVLLSGLVVLGIAAWRLL